MDIGKTLKEYRKKKNMTLNDVAEKLNVSATTISRYELNQRNITFDLLMQFSKALDIPLENIVASLFGIDYDNINDNDVNTLNEINRYHEQKEENIEDSELLKAYYKLNQVGKDKVTDYAIDLVDTGKYKKKEVLDWEDTIK